MAEDVDVPKRLRKRDVDAQWKLPVPVFAEDRKKSVDFQAVSEQALRRLILAQRCPICGRPVDSRTAWWGIGAPESFGSGDYAAEAVGHRQCVEYALKVCPWLLQWVYRRRSVGRPDVREVTDSGKPPVWVLVEGRRVQLYESGAFVYLGGARAKKLFGYVDRRLERVSLEEANELLAASNEPPLDLDQAPE